MRQAKGVSTEGFDSEAEAEALAEMLNRHRELLAEFASPHRQPRSPSGLGLGQDAFLEEVEAESAAIDRQLEKYDREFASPLRGEGGGAGGRSASERGGGTRARGHPGDRRSVRPSAAPCSAPVPRLPRPTDASVSPGAGGGAVGKRARGPPLML